MLQHLGPLGHQPNPVGRGGVGITHPLQQGQRALASLSCVLGELLGGHLRSPAVERHQVDNAAESGIGGKTLEDRPPRLPLAHRHRNPVDSGLIQPGLVIAGGTIANHHHRLIPGRQLLRQGLGCIARIRCQYPNAGLLAHLCRSLSQDHPAIGLSAGVRRVQAQDFCRRESRVSQRLKPHVGAGQGVMGAIVVGKPPPAVQWPEGEVQPAEAAESLQGHQIARRCQQPSTIAQRLIQELGGVQHVGRDHQVVAVLLEALLHGVDFDVQHPVVDRRLCSAKASLRLGEEAGGNIGVGVVKALGGELGQHRRSCRPGARPHLQHSQPPALRQIGQQCRHRVAEQAV